MSRVWRETGPVADHPTHGGWRGRGAAQLPVAGAADGARQPHLRRRRHQLPVGGHGGPLPGPGPGTYA